MTEGRLTIYAPGPLRWNVILVSSGKTGHANWTPLPVAKSLLRSKCLGRVLSAIAGEVAVYSVAPFLGGVFRGTFWKSWCSPLAFFCLLQSRPLHVPIVPMSVNVPVALSMLYIETLAEPEFVT